jgi:hypothetical protein
VSIRTASSGLLARTGSSSLPGPIKISLDNADAIVESTVVPPIMDEGESVVPVPDDVNNDQEEEIEVSITPMSVTQELPSPAASTPVVLVPDDDNKDREEEEIEVSITPMSVTEELPSPAASTQQEEQEHDISGVDAVVQEEKKEAYDHEDDALIEISDYDADSGETYEVIHVSDDADVVEGQRVEYTIERKTTEMSESSSKHSPTAQIKTHPSLTGEETNVASAHAAQIEQTFSNLEAHAAQIEQTFSNLEANAAQIDQTPSASVGETNSPVAGVKSLASEEKIPTAANTDVQLPKLVIEQTEAKQIPHASTERNSATTTSNESNETAGDRDDVLPEYSVR